MRGVVRIGKNRKPYLAWSNFYCIVCTGAFTGAYLVCDVALTEIGVEAPASAPGVPKMSESLYIICTNAASDAGSRHTKKNHVRVFLLGYLFDLKMLKDCERTLRYIQT